MSVWSEREIRNKAEKEQELVAKMVAVGKEREATRRVLENAKKGIVGLLDLPYEGKKVAEVTEYRDAKQLTDKLFAKVWKVYWGSAPFPLQKLMDFGDVDYMVSLYQGLDVLGLFNGLSSEMDERLRAWFIMGFYAFQFELAAKPLLTYTEVLTARSVPPIGETVKQLIAKYQVSELASYFDSFLRNAIDHSQYYMKDAQSGVIEAWEVNKGKKSEKRPYFLSSVFQMTVKLLFFIVAYYVSWYELMIELANKGAFHRSHRS